MGHPTSRGHLDGSSAVVGGELVPAGEPGDVTGVAEQRTGDVCRFASRDQFAAYNGTAPIEVSSGGRVAHRLSRRGNRNINHAIHMVAICQIRHTHSEGRAYFDRKVAEGKTKREAIRSLKRQISNTVYRHLVLDAAK